MNQRQMARFLKISPPSVAKALPLLIKEKIIIYAKDKEMNLSSISLNRDSKIVMQLKRAENLKLIYESGIVDFLEEKFPGSTIVLFGSYSRGDDIKTSDIDIAIIGSKEKEINLEEYTNFLEREIRINFYNYWKDIHKNLKENLLNGIILIGGVRL
jgi:predicted nucleotidyltransferase